MKRSLPWGEQVDLLSSDEPSALDPDVGSNGGYDCLWGSSDSNNRKDQPIVELSSEGMNN